MDFQTTIVLLTWAAIALLAFVVAGLVRRVHLLAGGGRPADPGPAVGAPAPHFARLAPDPAAERTLLLFLDADCGACPRVLAELRAIRAERGRPLPVAALYAGRAPREPAEDVAVHAEEASLFEEYRIPAVPFAVLVDRSGRVRAARPVGSPEALRELLAETGEGRATVPGRSS
ncbi:TlpA family protein disulfide reductase [Thermomonospora catenispora]|uniref:TlpA family protein disulfide reductase n=1 Tax=Thermomonospora catenispora TaxID=2493090 RepID=UPI001121FF29|nr:hypothetical protein [Thermomonospora catenispora]TNY37083.1 hypothetical protein EIO00_09550 [Thermomonospora catenispora]